MCFGARRRQALDVLKGRASVNLRLPLSQHVEIGSVQDKNDAAHASCSHFAPDCYRWMIGAGERDIPRPVFGQPPVTCAWGQKVLVPLGLVASVPPPSHITPTYDSGGL